MAFKDIYPFKWHWLDKNNLRFYTCFFHLVKLLKPCYYWKVKNHLGPAESSVFQLIPASKVVPFFFMQQVNRLLTPFVSCIPSVSYINAMKIAFSSCYIYQMEYNRDLETGNSIWANFFWKNREKTFSIPNQDFDFQCCCIIGCALVCHFVELKSDVLFCLKCLTFIDIARQNFQLFGTIHFNCKIQIIFGSFPRQCASVCVCYCSIQFK